MEFDERKKHVVIIIIIIISRLKRQKGKQEKKKGKGKHVSKGGSNHRTNFLCCFVLSFSMLPVVTKVQPNSLNLSLTWTRARTWTPFPHPLLSPLPTWFKLAREK